MRGLRRWGRQGARAAMASRVAGLQRICRRWEITLRQAILAVMLPLAGLMQQALVVRVEQGADPFSGPRAVTITVEMTGTLGRMTMSLRWTRAIAAEAVLGGDVPPRAS